MSVVMSFPATPSVAITAAFGPAGRLGLSGGNSQISRISRFSGASSIIALESLGSGVDASTLRSARNGEMASVMIAYPRIWLISVIRQARLLAAWVHFSPADWKECMKRVIVVFLLNGDRLTAENSL